MADFKGLRLKNDEKTAAAAEKEKPTHRARQYHGGFREMTAEMAARIEARAFDEVPEEMKEMVESAGVDPAGAAFPKDSLLWIELLTKAKKVSEGLYSTLLFIRGVGTELVPWEAGYRLCPVIGAGHWTAAYWQRVRRELMPWKQELTGLLAELGGRYWKK